jgi:hypothetical protein
MALEEYKRMLSVTSLAAQSASRSEISHTAMNG